MSLADSNSAEAKKVMAAVGPHIDMLAGIADQIKLPTAAKLLREQRLALIEDTFRLPVLGRFRNGKSTFLNALLCELTHSVPEVGAMEGPLPVKDLPTTVLLTTIDYGDTPAADVIKHDGTIEHWSLARFRSEAIIRRDPAETERVFKDVREFKLRLPSRTLQSGITLLDTPGTDDIRERTEIVKAVVHHVDAAIVMLTSQALGGQDERDFINSLLACGLTDLFFVINRRDGRVVDEDLKSEAWYRIAELCLGSPRYKGQDPADKNIFFVDAKSALEGRLTSDNRKLVESGMDNFERRLSLFLETERRPAHVRRFVQGADAQSKAVDEALQKLIPTVQSKAEEFRAKYQALHPQIADIRRRVDRLPKIIDGYRMRVEYALDTSFRELVNDLCRDLPAEMARQPIPSIDDASMIDKSTLPFRKGKIRKETEDLAKSIYEARLTAWRDNPPSQPGSQMVVGRLMEELACEIEDEIKGIKRTFDRIQFELTGFRPDVATAEQTAQGWAQRVLIGAATVVSPDYGYNLMALGWNGVLRGVLIHVATGGLVVFLGGPIAWGYVAGTLASLLWAALTAPNQLKERFRKEVCDALIPKLREIPNQAKSELAKQLSESFSQVEAAFRQSIESEVMKEEETLREQMETANKSAEDKRKLLGVLEHYRKQVKKCRDGLQNTLIAVEATRS